MNSCGSEALLDKGEINVLGAEQGDEAGDAESCWRVIIPDIYSHWINVRNVLMIWSLAGFSELEASIYPFVQLQYDFFPPLY